MLTKVQSITYVAAVPAQAAQAASTTCPPTPPTPPAVPLTGWSFYYTLLNTASGTVVQYYLYQGLSTQGVSLPAPYNAPPWIVTAVLPVYNP